MEILPLCTGAISRRIAATLYIAEKSVVQNSEMNRLRPNAQFFSIASVQSL